MTADILEQFQLATDSFTKLVAGVRPDQLAIRTPCPEWSVQELVSHVVTGNLMFTRLFTGAEPPAVDAVGDSVAAISVSANALREAASAEGALERTFTTRMGERTGAGLMTIRVVELSVHGWDLARATEQSFELPEVIVETCFEMLRAMLPEDRNGLPYGAEQQAGPEASPTQRLAAFAGRAVAA
jgi:uncharacterized protein (TIGR03086 family)